MNTQRILSLRLGVILPLILAVLPLPGQSAARDPDGHPPILTTNLVVVTNVVVTVVTNYVVSTNVVVTTNGVTAKPEKKPKRAPSPAVLPDLSWVPPADTFDWIQLKSGEWLKGRFKGMQKRELEFSSEEMDDETFDWKDIRQVRTHRVVDVLLENDKRASGLVTMTPTEIVVLGDNVQVFAHNEIQSLTPGGAKETFGVAICRWTREPTNRFVAACRVPMRIRGIPSQMST